MDYSKNVIVPINQKRNYLLISERKNGDIREKMELINKYTLRKGF